MIIYSYDDLLPWQANVRAGLQGRLDQVDADARPAIYEERIDGARIDSSVSDSAFTAYLQAKYSSFQFNAVIAESAAATRFLLLHPDLFAHAERFAIDPVGSESQAVGDSGIHVVRTQGDWAEKTLRTITALMPNVTDLIAIVDHSQVGEANKHSLLAASIALPRHVNLEIWDDFSFDELLRRVAHLPPGTAILYSPVFQDRTGSRFIPRTVVQDLVKVSSAPIFAHHDTFLGSGIVGGRLLSSRREGSMIADIALGTGYAEQGTDLDTLLNPFMFDAAALDRWNIAEDRLPAPYVLRGRDEPAWHQYRWQIGAISAALLFEGLLILWLITALRQRRTATLAMTRERDGLELRVSERTRDLLAAKRRLEDSNSRLEALANTDALTAVANRRRFLEVAETEVRRAHRYDRPLSFLMLDIDHFKSINDRYGHATGDEVIQAVANVCQTRIRAEDCVGRMGGEEFAILLPELDPDEAASSAERIRALIGAMRIDTRSGPLSVTVSIGVSTLQNAADTLDDLTARADAALYRAKDQGRDRVVSDGGTGMRLMPALDARAS